eukprot:scaffold85392_cov30-Tisochrysis_lutea.AAC.5
MLKGCRLTSQNQTAGKIVTSACVGRCKVIPCGVRAPLDRCTLPMKARTCAPLRLDFHAGG